MKPTKKPNLNGKTTRIFLQHVRKYRFSYAVTVLGLLAATALDLYTPFLYKQLIDLSAANDRTIQPLVLTIVLLVGVKLIGNIFYRIANFSNSYGTAAVMSDLLNTCFTAIHRHSYAFFSNSFAGSLVRKVNRFEDAFEDISDQVIWSIIPAAVQLTATVIILSQRSLWLGLGVLGWAILYIWLNYWFVTYKQKYDLQRVEANTAVSGHLADTFTNSTVVKLFTGGHSEDERFRSLTHTLYLKRKKTWDLDSLSQGVQQVLMALLELGAFLIAIQLWHEGKFTTGDFVFLQVFLIQVLNYLWGAGRYLRDVFEGFSNAAEMTELIIAKPDVLDPLDATDLATDQGGIVYSDVKFGYGTKPVLEGFNLTVKPGEKIALVGSSGSGKSTIVKLLFRFLDIQKGTISIDGTDIATVSQESLRKHIALVPQDALLFHRSIMENIRYGRQDATDKEVYAAAKASHCHEFIMRLPDGYKTMVGERGVKLSGGERQRVAIARAILKNAPILVLDEATSSLDSESEQLIQDALHTLIAGRTTIVIAHRLSTVMQMDTIYVLNHGKIVESGSHNELLKKEGGAYRRLWNIQAGGFIGEDE